MASGRLLVAADAGVGSRSLPWAVLPFLAVLGASCAAELSGSRLWDWLAATLLAAGLALGGRHWLPRKSGRIALLICIAAVALGALGFDLATIGAAAARMSGVVVLMLSVALLRPVFAERQLDAALAAKLARLPAALRPATVVVAAAAASLGLSFGAIGVLGATLGRRATPETTAACAAMRGLVLSMLLGPSTASVAAVMAVYPHLSWTAALGIGLPLALVGGALATLMAPPLVMTTTEKRRPGALLAAMLLLAELAMTLIAHVALRLSMTLSIALAAAALAIGTTLCWGRQDFGAALERLDDRISESWTSVMPESALFLAAGLLIGVMQLPELAVPLRHAVALLLPGGAWSVLAVLVLMPLVTLAGIHPMVPFAILAPVLSAADLGISTAGLYAMWIVAFMLSMLLSPVSVLRMMTSSNFAVPSRLLGWRGNGGFAAAFAGASALLIVLCCGA
ncbi:MAG TPA: hypothetical protein VLX85_13585 [Stellaceae bacterium]|nr:hypothetical protein [Stellaceae bacterium]